MMTAYRIIEASEVVSVAVAAKLLNTERATVRTWTKDGTIEMARVLGSLDLRIPRSEVIRLLREEVAEARTVRKLRRL